MLPNSQACTEQLHEASRLLARCAYIEVANTKVVEAHGVRGIQHDGRLVVLDGAVHIALGAKHET